MKSWFFLLMLFLCSWVSMGWCHYDYASHDLYGNEVGQLRTKKQQINSKNDLMKKTQLQKKVVKRLQTIIRQESTVRDFVEHYNNEDVEDFTSEQKKCLAKFLIQNYSDKIFSTTHMEDSKYVQRNMSSKFKQQQFLIEQAFLNIGSVKFEGSFSHLQRAIFIIYEFCRSREASQKN